MKVYLIFALLLPLAANLWPPCRKKELCRKAVFTAVTELVLIYALHLGICRFTLCNAPEIPVIAFSAVSCLFSFLFLTKRQTAGRLHRFLRTAAGSVCLAFLLEMAVFCGNAYSLHPFSADAEQTAVTGSAKHSDSGIIVSGNASVRLTFNAQDVRFLHIRTETKDSFYEVTCRMTDDNFAHMPQETGSYRMNASQEELCLAIAPYGTLYEAELAFQNVDRPIRIRSITATDVKPFPFSLLRMLGLSALLCLLAAIRIFRWHRLCYDRFDLLQRESIAVLLMLCIGAMLFVCPVGNARLYDYDPAAGVDTYDPYAQTFDAWQHGQLHLRIDPDPVLLELENPYDRSAREAAGAEEEWDKAFYNGKYYSYFGIAPVIFVYYPIFLCTGKLPNTEFTAAVFSVSGMIFLFLLLLTLVRKYCRRVNFLLLLLGLTCAAAVSGLFLCSHYADRYYVANAAGITFLYLFLWLGLEASLAENHRVRCLFLAGCGIAVTAAVLSRPTCALYAVLLLPVFLPLLRRSDLDKRRRLTAVTSFALPLFIGAAVTMAYNAARFSSPLDFGSTYQLTISNTAANRVQLGELPAAMVQYFLHPLEFGGQFPFIRMDTVEFAQNGRYVYVTEGFGALCFWCIPAALLLLCFLKISREEKQFCMLGYAAAVLTAFLDHCMGGYNTRYLCDILPVLAVCSVLLLLQGAQSLRKHRAAFRAAVLLFLQAPLLLTAVFLSLGENSSMWYGHPDFYFILRDCLVFWQ